MTCKDCKKYKNCTRAKEKVSLMTTVEELIADDFKCFESAEPEKRIVLGFDDFASNFAKYNYKKHNKRGETI